MQFHMSQLQQKNDVDRHNNDTMKRIRNASGDKKLWLAVAECIGSMGR